VSVDFSSYSLGKATVAVSRMSRVNHADCTGDG
jgi:hypothetical protein